MECYLKYLQRLWIHTYEYLKVTLGISEFEKQFESHY